MKKIHFIYQISIILCLFALIPQSQGLALQGHKRDLRAVFGVDSRLFDEISSGIDVEFRNRFIKEIGPVRGNHRLVGHWGFGGKIPFNQEPYKTALAGYSKSEIVNLWKNFVNEKVEFARIATGLTRTQSKGLVGLIYDIHLLGDYTTAYTAPLPKPKYIAKDIVKSLRRLMGNNSPVARQIERELMAIPERLSDKAYVARVEAVLKKHQADFKPYKAALKRVGVDPSNITASAKKSNLLKKGELVAKKSCSGIVMNALLVSGLIFANWALQGDYSIESLAVTVAVTTAVAATGVVVPLALEKGLETVAKKMPKIGKIAGPIAKWAGKGIPVLGAVLSVGFAGKAILDYHQGSISSKAMIAEVSFGLLYAGAAVGTLFFGPVGTTVGMIIGGIATVGQICYMTWGIWEREETQQRHARELELIAQLETEHGHRRFEQRIADLRNGAIQKRNEAWRMLQFQVAE